MQIINKRFSNAWCCCAVISSRAGRTCVAPVGWGGGRRERREREMAYLRGIIICWPSLFLSFFSWGTRGATRRRREREWSWRTQAQHSSIIATIFWNNKMTTFQVYKYVYKTICLTLWYFYPAILYKSKSDTRVTRRLGSPVISFPARHKGTFSFHPRTETAPTADSMNSNFSTATVVSIVMGMS